jgi:TonB family protein
MDPRFRHYLKLSTIVHAALILAIIIASLLNWDILRKRKRIVTFVDFTVALPEAAETAPGTKAPEAPEKPPPGSRKDIPEPVKSSRPKIETSKKKVVRPAPKPKTPPLSPDEIKRLLAAGARIADRTSIPDNYLEVGYYQMVHDVFYKAWKQPGDLSSAAGLWVEVTVRVNRDGTITSRRVTRASGNPLMDDSVRKATDLVDRLPPLPATFGGYYKDIVVEFELTRGAP